MIDPAILNLVRKVCEAAANPSRWPEFLTPYMQAVGASADRQRLLFMNRAANSLLNLRDGLEWAQGRLRATDRETAVRLNGLLAAVFQTAAGAGITPGSRLSIPRPSLRRPFEVLVAPLPLPPGIRPESEARVAIFLTDPESQTVPDAEALRQLYGLIGAEARIAAALVQGRNISEAAEEFGISLNTARTQVKSVLSKTQTRRQSDLERLLLTGLSRVNFPGT